MSLLRYFFCICIVGASVQAQQWNALGPFVPPTGSSTIGQINTIAFNPQNPLKMWAGSPAGGLWSSTDGGQHWLNANIDTLGVIGISDIWMNPTDSNNIVLALGDRDENATYIPQGGALLQTVDGGVTWTRSGELDTSGSIVPILNYTTSRLIRNTANGTFFLATSAGLFSSTNFGLNWNTRPYKEKVWDIRTRPTDATVVYAVIGGKIYRSLNGGTSFSMATTGLPTTVASRIQLAVTPANSAVVYALFVNSDGTYGGLYKSSDFGATWNVRSSIPNILAANLDGSGSKGINNLALCVSPTNENIVFAGGVNIWRSNDGGVTWFMSSHYTGSFAPYVSADIHELKFAPAPRNQILYAATGSGVFTSADTGRTWQNYSTGLQVAQMNCSAFHPQRDSLYITSGPTGVHRYLYGNWSRVSDSASLQVMFHPTTTNLAYMATANGKLFRSKDTANSFVDDIGPAAGINGQSLTPYVFNPKNYNTIYAVLRDIWKTTNGGATWVRTINTFNANILSLTVSPKDTNRLYMITSDTSLYRSTNGGSDWTRVGTCALQNPGVPRAIYCHPTDTTKLCIIGGRCLSMSTDKGVSWNKYILTTNTYITSFYWKADNCGEDLIVGSANGVWKLSSQFQFLLDERFGSQIPNSPVLDLKLSGRWLRAATAGRGLYQAFIDDVGVVPEFSQDKVQVCPGEYVQFYDRSKFGGLLTRWTFESGIPNTSLEEAPLVRYDAPGDHWVRLVAANGCGRDSVQRICITVIPKLKANINPAKTSVCVGDTVQVLDQSVGTGGTREWTVEGGRIVKQSGTTIFVRGDTVGQISLTLTLSNTCGTNAQSKVIDILEAPSKPVVSVVKDTMSIPAIPGQSYQWYVNGNPLNGTTGPRCVGLFSAQYFVRVSNAGGCRVYSDTVNFVKTPDDTTGTSVYDVAQNPPFSVQPNPTSSDLRVIVGAEWIGRIQVCVRDLTGRVLLQQYVEAQGAETVASLNLKDLANGVYSVELRKGLLFNSALFVKKE